VTASEDATYTATVRTVGGGRVGIPVSGMVKAYGHQRVPIGQALPPGRYTIAVVLRAATNPSRLTTLVSRPFQVAPAAH
jgi:hypothetical protein